MSDSIDRRAAQKARTRASIRAAAHEMFGAAGFDATTVVDIAAAAGVSVQTVFNHFASKEDLFFADRAEWVDGPAAAIRNRPAGVPPKSALRRYLVDTVEGYMREATACPNHRRMIEVLESTPALLAYERGLHEQAVEQLADAFAEVWGCQDDDPSGSCAPVLAEVTASVWMAAVRAIIIESRSVPPLVDDHASVRRAVELADRVLADLDTGLDFAEVSAAGMACRNA